MRKIIVEELLRAVCVFIFLMWILGNFKNAGVLAVSTSSLFAAGGGVSAAVFSVLVVLRRRTGKEYDQASALSVDLGIGIRCGRVDPAYTDRRSNSSYLFCSYNTTCIPIALYF